MTNGATLHIAFCGEAYRDYEALRSCEKSGRETDPWPVPSTALRGDRVLFYNTDRETSFVASGEVASKPESDGSGAHYHYRAPIKKIAMLTTKLSLQQARDKFPSWGWLKHTQNITTVPQPIAQRLWSLTTVRSRLRKKNREDQRHWVGGFGEPERLEGFLRLGVWRMGWPSISQNPVAQKCWDWLHQIRRGDLFAIKGYGGRNDIKIHRTGVVTAVDLKRGEVHFTAERVVPFSFPAPRIGGGGNWFWALSPVVSAQAIRKVFGAPRNAGTRTHQTASRAKPMFGPKLYQERARRALPALVAVAHSRQKIYYEDLGAVLGISNPRTLNFVLGSIGQTLIRLSNDWGRKIPPIQCLVINKVNELPGEGVEFFIEKRAYRALSKSARRKLVDKIHDKIWSFPCWSAVLDDLFLNNPKKSLRRRVVAKSHGQGGGYGSPEENKKVETAAVVFVKDYLRRRHFRVKSRERDRVGYDLEASKHGRTLFIEVKGVSGNVPGFIITHGEFKKAGELEDYWIYVVTRAIASPKLHRFAGIALRSNFTFKATAFRAIPK